MKERNLTRRDFLRTSAVAAGGAVLAACGGGGTTTTGQNGGPTAPAAQATEGVAAKPTRGGGDVGRATAIKSGSKFKEAPALADMVKAGKLPAVAERLPKNPYVVPHKWLKPGKYGGQLQQVCSDTTGTYVFIKESMYGHSLLRWLKDGLEIGPGLVESWEPNKDLSEWTLHFREGLKWSDGKPWTTADIMYWWEDEVLNEEHPEGPPDEARSGKGTLMNLKAPDDTTMVMKFDAPTPLTADRLAMWVKRGIGPIWMEPRHYMEQFHPKYNPKLKNKKDWVTDHDTKKEFGTNPDNPVMTGWKLKSHKEGQNSVWERNPFYWCVDKEGNQLPYIDGITMTNFQDKEVMKLRITEGKADYVHGGFVPLGLSDVSTLKQSQNRSKLELRFWDGGDGTGSSFFFNYDYPDPKMRDLIREPKFRQALSLASNRKELQKVVYFNTGEPTTGTMSPKAIEFNINDEGKKVYRSWRDSYVQYDPDRAKKLLDEIGVKDTNGDGLREMPDGAKLRVTLDYGADTAQDNISKNTLLAKDWKAIGIDAKLNPVPPQGRDDRWKAGKLMSNADWGIGDGPNCLVYPQWLVPLEETRWAPLEGSFYAVRGTPKEKSEKNVDPYKRHPPRLDAAKGGPVERLWKIYDQTKTEVDPMKRHKLVWDMIKIHIEEGPFVQGIVANTPTIILVREGLKNVPQKEDLALGGFTGPWIIPCPAVYDPETYYWDNPEAHT